jgi:ArsR family metal-binding transcriptional regulator
MLIAETEIKKEFLRSKCNPSAQSIHCIVHLKKDISKVIPYLNAELGGDACSKKPPFVTFKVMGKLITIHPDKIAINALKDMEQAEKIILWIIKEINRVWDQRDKITPTYEIPPKPQPLEILKLLPKTNCRKCNLPTCMVFATQMAQGVRDVKDCPELSAEKKKKLKEYLDKFPGINLEI